MNDTSALEGLLRQRTLMREATLAAVQSLGTATTRQVADALGITRADERNRLRARLESYARQSYVRCGRSVGTHLVTWTVIAP